MVVGALAGVRRVGVGRLDKDDLRKSIVGFEREIGGQAVEGRNWSFRIIFPYHPGISEKNGKKP